MGLEIPTHASSSITAVINETVDPVGDYFWEFVIGWIPTVFLVAVGIIAIFWGYRVIKKHVTGRSRS